MPLLRVLLLVALATSEAASARKNLEAKPAAAVITAVVAKPLREIAAYPERDAPAQVASLNESRIASEITARIEALPVEVGQTLAKGALVAKLDCRDHELARDRARAALDASRSRAQLAEQQLERARQLHQKEFISREALAQRDTELAVQKAEIAQNQAIFASAMRTLEKCTVRAPFAAIVKSRSAQTGELAAPGTPLAVLLDTSRIEVAAQVQPRDLESLNAAKEIRFSGAGVVAALQLVRASPAIQRETRSVDVRLRFAHQLLPLGSDGRIVWTDSRAHVPARAVVRRNGKLGAFVLEGGTARFREIAGAQEGRPAPAPFGPETRVVIEGQFALQNGDKPATGK